MGTVARVVRDADGGLDVRSLFAEIDRRLSRFDPGSDLSRLNADPRPCVPAGPLLRAAVAAALRAASLTGGLVDPTLLGALRRAGYGESRAHVQPSSLARGAWRSAATAPGSPQPGRRVARGRGRRRRGRDPPAAGPGARPRGLGQGVGGRLCRCAARAPRALRRRLRRRPARGGRERGAVGGARSPSADRRDRAHAAGQRRRRGDLRHRRAAVGASGGRLRPPPDRPRHGMPAWTGLVAATALAPTAVEAEALAKAALLSGPAAGRRLLRAGTAGCSCTMTARSSRWAVSGGRVAGARFSLRSPCRNRPGAAR